MIVSATAALLLAAAAPPPVHYFPAGPDAPFSSAVRVGEVLHLSGMIGLGPDGKLPDGIEAQTKQVMDNIGGVLKRAGVGYDAVFHCTAFLADMKDWPAFNGVYVTYFKPDRRPARSALGVSGLALGALVEVECQAYAGKP